MPFKNFSETAKYLDINLTKCAQDLYAENNKTLTKGNKKALNKLSDTLCS